MKKTMIMLFALCAAACTKEMRVPSAQSIETKEGNEICFEIKAPNAYMATKVTEVNTGNLTSFNLMTTRGGAGSEVEQWSASATKNPSTGRFETGKYWPSTDPSYHFYASNAALTAAAGGPTVSVDGSADVVCACIYTPEYGNTNPVVFSHIMARIGSVEVASANGYEVAVLGLTIMEPQTVGTYNVRTAEWSNQNGNSTMALSEGSNDYLLLPRTYALEVRYRLTKGDYTATFTSVGDVTLDAGKVSNISVTLSADPAIPVNFSVSVLDWNASTVGLTLD